MFKDGLGLTGGLLTEGFEVRAEESMLRVPSLKLINKE